MTESELKKVQDNNRIINEIVNSIIKMRREHNITIQIGDSLEPIAKEVFKLVNRNILTIYKAEYGQYGFSECRGKEDVSLNPARPGDCSGGTDGLGIGLNLNEFLWNSKNGVYVQLEKYGAQESGAETAEQYDGSEKDQIDLFLKFKDMKAIDIDWVIGAIAHEAKHTYGVVGGNTFLREGITEQTTREDCDRYEMYMEPTSHTQEANFIRRLKLIVGREEIVKAGLYDGHIRMRDIELSKIIQEYDNISIEQLEEYFKISRYDDKKIDEFDSKQKDASKKLRIKLERFRKEHPELVDRMAEIINKYDKMDSETRYESLDLAFDKALMNRKPPVEFKKLRSLLDNIYSLQIHHKKDPNFYRKLYSENWSEFLNDDDWVTLLGVESLEGVDLEQIKQEGIDIYGTGENVKNYVELIEPITTYIRNNNLEHSTNDMITDRVDLTQVIENQNDIIQQLIELHRKQKMQIAERIAMFHDQKSDGAFRVVETGVHTITETDIKQVAKTNEVVAEKENAMQAIKANEKELEIDEKKEL